MCTEVCANYLDDIQVRFFEEKDGVCIWEDFADFQASDVHKQVAIWFKTPSYKTMQVNLNFFFFFNFECTD